MGLALFVWQMWKRAWKMPLCLHHSHFSPTGWHPLGKGWRCAKLPPSCLCHSQGSLH